LSSYFPAYYFLIYGDIKKARAENCLYDFLVYTVWQGFLGQVPRQAILNETVRNLYFHVTMWFSMIFLLATSVVHSIRYLRKGNLENDLISNAYVETGLVLLPSG